MRSRRPPGGSGRRSARSRTRSTAAPVRFARSCGSRAWSPGGIPRVAGMPGARLSEMTPYCPRRSICGKKGAKATCSWPRARSMAARADRSRGLLRRAKAMASPSAKIVGLASGPPGKWIWGPLARIIWLDDGFRGVNVQVRGNQDSRRHCRIGDFRRDGQRPVPGSTACEKEEGYEYPGAAQ